MTNQVSFGKQSGTVGSVLGSVGSSALNVGVTMGAGAGVGACIGKLASLTPYKPSAAALEHQYTDMFIKAVQMPKAPEYLAGIPELKTAICDAKKVNLYTSGKAQAEDIKKLCGGFIEKIKETPDIIKNEGVQEYAKRLLKSKSENPLTGEEVVGAFEKHIKKADTLLEKIDKKLAGRTVEGVFGDFVEKAKNCDTTKELAESGAKHLRKNTIIGIGIAIGVVGALVINLLHTNGVIKLGKRTQNNQQNSSVSAKTPIHGTTQG